MAPNHLARVDEQVISIRDMADLVAQIDTALQRARGFTLFTLNLDHLVKRRHDAAFRELYDRATFVTADGWPVVRLARRHDRSIVRTAGADAVVPLCRLAARRRIPIAVFGSTKTVLDAAAARLRQLAPGLEIRFAEAPPFGFDPLGADGQAAMARLETSGAGLCFVALGAPKQELFADGAVRRGSAIGFACIGAGLDFIAGAQTRAPSLVQAIRLEWAWRLFGAPRRLGTRYLRCAILYARLLATAGGPTGAAR